MWISKSTIWWHSNRVTLPIEVHCMWFGAKRLCPAFRQNTFSYLPGESRLSSIDSANRPAKRRTFFAITWYWRYSWSVTTNRRTAAESLCERGDLDLRWRLEHGRPLASWDAGESGRLMSTRRVPLAACPMASAMLDRLALIECPEFPSFDCDAGCNTRQSPFNRRVRIV